MQHAVCMEYVIDRRAGRTSPQCGTFTGMIPVYGVLLIIFEWYWYMVCESGIRISLILLARSVGRAPDLVSEGVGFDSRVGLSGFIEGLLRV